MADHLQHIHQGNTADTIYRRSKLRLEQRLYLNSEKGSAGQYKRDANNCQQRCGLFIAANGAQLKTTDAKKQDTKTLASTPARVPERSRRSVNTLKAAAIAAVPKHIVVGISTPFGNGSTRMYSAVALMTGL